MIKEIVNKLVNNIDPADDMGARDINIVMSGGAFNASYMAGCLYFLKELRECGLIRINKISTCSASALLGLLFMIDKMDIFVDKLYTLDILSNMFNFIYKSIYIFAPIGI